MSNSVFDVLGRYPIPGSFSFEADVRAVASEWKARCPIERARTVYFSLAEGDDDNPGTLALPRQSITEMNNVFTEYGDGVCVRLKRGDTWRTLTTVDTNGGALAAYGDDADPIPRLTGYSTSVGPWDLGAGSRYYTPSAEPGWVLDETLGFPTCLAKVDSTAEVEATTHSWYWDGQDLHVNVGSNPNLHAIYMTLDATAGYDGVKVSNGSRVDSIQADGQAFNDTLDQSYGFAHESGGEALACVTNSKAYHHSRHNLGRNGGSGTGGRLLIEGCEFGGCYEDGGTMFVSYANEGENEAIVLDCDVPYGRVKFGTDAPYSSSRAIYGHRGSVGTLGPQYFINVHVKDSNYPCEDIGNIADPTQANGVMRDSVTVFHRCKQDFYDGAYAEWWRSSTVWSSCDLPFKPFNSNTGAGSATGGTGWVLASRVKADFSLMGDIHMGFCNPPDRLDFQPNIINCWFEITPTSTYTSRRLGLCYDSTNAGVTSTVPDARVVNSVFVNTIDAREVYIGLANETDSGLNNVFYQIDDMADLSRTRAVGNWQNNTVLDNEPDFDSMALPFGYERAGALGYVDTPALDINGNPLQDGTIGPLRQPNPPADPRGSAIICVPLDKGPSDKVYAKGTLGISPGTAVNGFVSADGPNNRFQNAQEFSNSEYVQFAHLNALEFESANDSFTVSAWAYVTTATEGYIFGQVSGTAQLGWGLYVDMPEDGSVSITSGNSSASGAKLANVCNWATGWGHITVVVTGGVAYFYRNGTYVGSAGVVDDFTGDNGNFNIGVRNESTVDAVLWDGRISDACIWDYALTPAQIAAVYNSNSLARSAQRSGRSRRR